MQDPELFSDGFLGGAAEIRDVAPFEAKYEDPVELLAFAFVARQKVYAWADGGVGIRRGAT